MTVVRSDQANHSSSHRTAATPVFVFWTVLGGFIVLGLSMVIGILVWVVLADLLMKQA